MVTPIPRLRPEAFALQTATLDRVSGGRLILGVGLGSPDAQFTAFGLEADPRIRAAQTDEFLDVITQLWTGEPVTFHGRHYTVDNVTVVPRPVQRPRIPIWIGADGRRAAPRRRAARWDGFVPASESWPHGVIRAAEYADMVAGIHRVRSPGGPFDVVVIGNAAGTEPSTEALADYARAGVTWVVVQALTPDDARARIASPPRP